jgi:hypothetical protein
VLPPVRLRAVCDGWWQRRHRPCCSVAARALWTRLGLAEPMVPIKREAAAAAYVQQRGGGDFTGPSGLGRACLAWCVPVVASGRHPPMAVEDVLQVAVLLLLSGSIGLVCSCHGVWSATVYGGGGCALPRGCRTAAPCLRLSLLSLTGRVCHGETSLVTTRPWWCMVGGKIGGALRIVRRCGFLGVGSNPCHLGIDAVTLASVTIPS